MYHIRAAHDGDLNYLLDADIKCFDVAWTPDEWRAYATEYTIAVATYNGTPIGFVVFIGCADWTYIEKLCVKPAHRCKGVGRSLLRCAATAMNNKPLHMLIPESMTDPDNPRCICGWLTNEGFAPELPFVEDAFTFCGETENGILFVRSLA